jgi:hypothetical protein
MNVILLLLRILLGPLAPSWNEGVPLAVRRDGRLQQNRPGPEAPPWRDRKPPRGSYHGPLLIVWKALLRAAGRAGRWMWPAPVPPAVERSGGS